MVYDWIWVILKLQPRISIGNWILENPYSNNSLKERKYVNIRIFEYSLDAQVRWACPLWGRVLFLPPPVANKLPTGPVGNKNMVLQLPVHAGSSRYMPIQAGTVSYKPVLILRALYLCNAVLGPVGNKTIGLFPTGPGNGPVTYFLQAPIKQLLTGWHWFLLTWPLNKS